MPIYMVIYLRAVEMPASMYQGGMVVKMIECDFKDFDLLWKQYGLPLNSRYPGRVQAAYYTREPRGLHAALQPSPESD